MSKRQTLGVNPSTRGGGYRRFLSRFFLPAFPRGHTGSTFLAGELLNASGLLGNLCPAAGGVKAPDSRLSLSHLGPSIVSSHGCGVPVSVRVGLARARSAWDDPAAPTRRPARAISERVHSRASGRPDAPRASERRRFCGFRRGDSRNRKSWSGLPATHAS